jgi:hypothetical protein
MYSIVSNLDPKKPEEIWCHGVCETPLVINKSKLVRVWVEVMMRPLPVIEAMKLETSQNVQKRNE